MKIIPPYCAYALNVLVVCVCAVAGYRCLGAETSLRMNSEPGDFIGAGRQHFYTPSNGTFTASRNFDQGVSIRLNGIGLFWNLDFAAAGNQLLSPGAYFGATRFPFQSPNQHGLSVYGDGRGCNTVTGRFRVKQVSYGTNGTINSFWALFDQHCEGLAPALTGEIRFNADVIVAVDAPFGRTVERGQTISFPITAKDINNRRVTLTASNLPPGASFTDHGNSTGTFSWPTGRSQSGTFQVGFFGSNGAGGTDNVTTEISVVGFTSLAMNSDPGDFIGAGRQHFYGLTNAIFVGRNSDSGISIQFAEWSLEFSAPFDERLTAGVYTNATRWPFQSPDHAGLSISGQGRGCNTLTGRFEVRQVEYGPNDEVQVFWATFEQHCEGATPALRGEIRYNADVFVSVMAPAQLKAELGESVMFGVQATTVNGGAVSLSSPNLPSGATFLDNGDSTGTFAWRVTQPGIHHVTFLGVDSVEDGGHATTLIHVPGPTALLMQSDAGDYIGSGHSYFFTTNEGILTVSGNSNQVSASFDGSGHIFNLHFAAPAGQPLRPGTYLDVARYDSQAPTQPGLAISGDLRSCNMLTGQFQIKQVTFSSNGIDSFWAFFEQHCEGAVPALTGQIRYNANVNVTVTAPFSRSAQRGQTIMFDVTASDINRRRVTLTASNLPPGATFVDNGNNTGRFSWAVGLTPIATYPVSFFGDNGAGNRDFATTGIKVIGDTFLSMSSEPGDYIGGGVQHFYTPADGVFTASGNFDQGVSIGVNGFGLFWYLDFAAPANQPLNPGMYNGAARFPFQSPNQPGLSVYGDGRGCNTLTGRFRVKQVSYGAGSAINSFWAVFEQHCEGLAPALIGEIRFNADVIVTVNAPLSGSVERGQPISFPISATDITGRRVTLTASNLPPGASFTDHGDNTGTFSWPTGRGQFGTYAVTFLADNSAGQSDFATTEIKVLGYTSLAMNSDPGDFIGAGRQHFYGLTNGPVFALRNSDSGISIQFAEWNLEFSAPFDERLTAGVYTNATRWPFQSPDHAGLSISGQGRGCNTLTGRFEVRQLEYGPNDEVQVFWATFEQHCEGATPALRGEIRYNADVFVFVTAPAQLRAELGDSVTFGVQAATVNGSAASLSAANLPSGATFLDNGNSTGTFAWRATQPGIHRVTFLGFAGVEDGGHATTFIQVPGPTALIMQSDGGDYIGAGRSYFFTPTEGVLEMSGNSNHVSARFDGSGHNFNLDFAAPAGQPLRPGTYLGAVRYPFQSSTEPGLSVWGDGRGCNMLTGQFTVLELSLTASNTLQSFWVAFEQHCESAGPALRGELRCNAALTINQPPILDPIPPQIVNEGTQLRLAIVARDNDVPTNRLTFSLGAGAPSNASIHPTNGVFAWTPTEEQGPGSNIIQIVVADSHTPSLSATQAMSVVVHEVNTAPALLPVPVQTASVLTQLRVTNTVTDPDIPSNHMRFSLGPGTPFGARIHTNSGIFSWTPSRAQARSSNFMTVMVTDSGIPPFSATNGFSVLVGDFLELSLGSTVVRAGGPGSVPITMDSSTGVTNLSFIVEAPEGRLTNFALQQLPADVSGAVAPSGPSRWQINLSANGGTALEGNRHLGQLAFTATTNQLSSLIPIGAAGLTTMQSRSGPLPKPIANGGRVVIVGTEPLLEALHPTNQQRRLVLYGIPQTSYTLESITDIALPTWKPVWQGTLTNLVHPFDALNSSGPIMFYRARGAGN